MADLVRYGDAAFEDSRSGEARRLLEFVDSCLSDGDEYVANAVLVSFIDTYGYGRTSQIRSWQSGQTVSVLSWDASHIRPLLPR